ncbi:MAG: threonylcarbamoyl-AMP synthase [Chthonomonas sp.]|nr:threonylcarbamoyl-AMP synthase [Chthonomonas sp.]
MNPTPKNIAACSEALLRGELVVVPTETVYGLAANALDSNAVQKIFAAKGRPEWNPVIVHVSGIDQAKEMVEWNDLATALANAFWPGPLTLVLPDKGKVAKEILAGGTTLGVRCPNHSVFETLLLNSQLPLAAPSANRFTQLSPTRYEDIDPEILKHCLGALDGGPSDVGIESTVVAINDNQITILRQGAVTQEQLSQFAPTIIAEKAAKNASPGQHHRHYSPKNPVKLVEPGTSTDRTIRLTTDPKEYAQQLYAKLAELDRTPGTINVERPPESPEWAAIWDRLRRAASDSP